MSPYQSRAVVVFDGPFEFPHRRASAPAPSTKKSKEDTANARSATCCSGGHHDCCCNCRTCSCPRSKPIKVESNRETYNGQGGRPGVLSPENGLLDTVSRYAGSSLGTEDSHYQDQQSFNNSFEMHDRLNDRLTVRCLNLDININRGTRAQYAESTMSEDIDHPWHQFLSSPDSLDHMSLQEDSSGMVIPGFDTDSMLVHTPAPTNDERSLLSSQYSEFFTSQSVTASQMLDGTGDQFSHQFLRLTPECRHTRTRQMCQQCVHY